MLGPLPAAATAMWLGVLTSMSPCPLASNIAAISYVGQGVSHPRRILAAGLLYAAGRAVTYALLGWMLARSIASVTGLSNSLQSIMNQALGPVLIVTGMFLLQLLEWKWGSLGSLGLAGWQSRVSNQGLPGAVALGSLFALSFCPVSAALFFGSLIPLAAANSDSLLLPSLYGIGTSVPVIAFALFLGAGSQFFRRAFEKVTRLEAHARKATGLVFIGAGFYYSLKYIFEVFA